jgi:tRNA dimethylallyltransferase
MIPPLISIIGPTGSGKTTLAEALALSFSGELVSCDAKQVYRGMDIGTNKEKVLKVPQHLVDIKEPGEKITVAEYQELAYATIEDIQRRGKLPILVGGSMLYAEAVMNGYLFEGEKSTAQEPHYKVLKLSPLVPRGELRERQKHVTAKWLKSGLLLEIQGLLYRGVSPDWLDACGLEYRYFTQHLKGEIGLEEATYKTNMSLGQYIKRQEIWWRRHDDIHFIQSEKEARALVSTFLADL